MKTLVVTEKKSVADDFAKVLGGFKRAGELAYEREDMVIAWASGHLLELQDPSAYDERYQRWALADLPIIPERFARVPRKGTARTQELLKNLMKQMKRKDIGTIVNACDAGREGELIFNLILDHAGLRGNGDGDKKVQRLWLQSMTTPAIRQAFSELRSAADFTDLKNAAYARDEADWMVGMNGTRAFTKKFMGRARHFLAVGRVKTPTLAFLVDREREIDAFRPVPYFQVDATFESEEGSYQGRWNGPDEQLNRGDRLQRIETARQIADKVRGQPGRASEKHATRTEIPPLLYDLTSLQREASNRFGYTLDRTLSLAQSLYEARKAITYPRTSSRYLPSDYQREVPELVRALQKGPLASVAALALEEVDGTIDRLRPLRRDRVFNDAKVSDHFALIPTGEDPRNLKDDERRIYELIVRRFLAVFLPPAQWDQVTRETLVEDELFISRERRLARAGWRRVEPLPDQKDLAPLPPGGLVTTKAVEVLEKETMPPPRYTDGSLVKAMETAGRDVTHPDSDRGAEMLDDEVLEGLKEKGIGTPATRAAIVKDLIQKRLCRRQGRNILPTPLGCTLVRLVRNLDLGVLAKADLTGNWEYRLTQMAHGGYRRSEWDRDIREMVKEMVSGIRAQGRTNDEIFRADHPAGLALRCPRCRGPLIEKTFSFMCSDPDCEVSFSKDQKGKYVFPETMARLLREGRVGPLTGFERTRAAGTLVVGPDQTVEIELHAAGLDETEETDEPNEAPREEVPEGTVMGRCPRCGGEVRREGSGYRCERNIPRKKDKECDFRLAERIKYRFLPPAQVRKLLSGEKTEELFGFVSMRGRKFRASLHYDAKGELKWEFPPRKPRVASGAAGKGSKARKPSRKPRASKRSGPDDA